jgi:hypothetical protein
MPLPECVPPEELRLAGLLSGTTRRGAILHADVESEAAAPLAGYSQIDQFHVKYDLE